LTIDLNVPKSELVNILEDWRFYQGGGMPTSQEELRVIARLQLDGILPGLSELNKSAGTKA
jgi:hypothetical protein